MVGIACWMLPPEGAGLPDVAPPIVRAMKAVGVVSFGGPDALEVVELPDPEAGPGEVRIRVHAATVNPTDTGLRNGARAAQLKDIPPPYVPGMDAAGVLDQIGEGVSTALQPGDHVMAIVVPSGSHGAYSELIVVPVESVARVPAGVVRRPGLDPPDERPDDADGARRAGTAARADPGRHGGRRRRRWICDPAGEDPRAPRGRRRLARGRATGQGPGRRPDCRPGPGVRRSGPPGGAGGVDGLVDAAILDQLAVPAVRDGGRIATLRGYQGAEERGITFHPVFVRNYAREQAKLDGLRQLAEEGIVTLRVAAVLPADQAPEAHRRLEAGGTRGRLVLAF